jgi:twitching motility two-component system response regulator PilG
MSGFIVALCDLQPKDARLLEIVLSRAPGRRFDFRIVNADDAGYADIVIADADRADPGGNLERLRKDSPDLVEVYVSETGEAGIGSYRIAKRSLVLHCFRLLESIGETKLRGSVGGAAAAPPEAAPPEAAPPASVGIEAVVQPVSTALELRGLVVDDSATVRAQLEVTLQRAGLVVDTAEEGDSALAKLQAVVYDLVFLDVVMPGLNGYELCRKIRGIRNGRHVPVVMLTSRSSPFDRARGALAGCDSYLTKPVAVKEFYNAVHKTLCKRFALDELAARGYKRLA